MRPTILILEITLPETSPPIWRIVEVKQNSTLHELHAVIQVAMGWENAHLYSFTPPSLLKKLTHRNSNNC